MRATQGSARARGRHDDRASNLLTDVACGDVQAFRSYYDVVIPLVFDVVNALVRDETVSEEVTQSVMVEVWRIAPRWDRAERSGIAFAVLIAHQRAGDFVQSTETHLARQRRFASVTQVNAVDGNPATATSSTFDGSDSNALIRLPAALRDPIILAFYGGLTYREIALQAGQSLATVPARVCSGLSRMRPDLRADSVVDADMEGG